MTDNVTKFLASGIEIKGTIRFQNDMHIDGKIEGDVYKRQVFPSAGHAVQWNFVPDAGAGYPVRSASGSV